MTNSSHHRITVLVMTFFVVLGSLPLGAVGMAAADGGSSGGTPHKFRTRQTPWKTIPYFAELKTGK
jgi:hypothetical protein